MFIIISVKISSHYQQFSHFSDSLNGDFPCSFALALIHYSFSLECVVPARFQFRFPLALAQTGTLFGLFSGQA